MQDERVTAKAQSNLDYLIELKQPKVRESKQKTSLKFHKEYKTCGSSKIMGLKQKLRKTQAPRDILRMFAPPLM